MMLPPAGGSEARRKLLALFDRLEARDRETLLALAEFLAARGHPVAPEPLASPRLLPRPREETVIAAIKRLSASYPMVERGRLLTATSSLMTQHILHGRPAAEVIDELERAFAAQYEALVAECGPAPGIPGEPER